MYLMNKNNCKVLTRGIILGGGVGNFKALVVRLRQLYLRLKGEDKIVSACPKK